MRIDRDLDGRPGLPQPSGEGAPDPVRDARSGDGAAPRPTPAAPPSPSTLRIVGCIAASVALALAQGFGQSVVSANIQQLQGDFGATQAETAWLTAAYMAPNVSLTLMLIKIRNQFGLRSFAEISILGFLAAALLNYAAPDLRANLAVRFFSGVAAAPMTSLAFLYFLEAVPPERKMNMGLSLALTLVFMGSPLTRLVSPHLLEIGGWHGLTAMECALAMIGFGLIYLIPLGPVTMPMKIEALDLVSFAFIAVGFGAAAVALTLGSIYWWFEAPWIGVLLAVAVGTLAVAAAIELNRERPLIDIRWVTSREVLHFAGALLLFRLVLSEQTSGAAGLFRSLGLLNAQLQGLWALVVAVTVAGGVICAALLKPGREYGFHVVALACLIAGSLMDAGATSSVSPSDMYLSQGLIALASSLFLAPAMLRGLMSAMSRGTDYLLSFVIVFLTTQKLGGLLGAAVFSTFVKIRTRLHLQHLYDQLSVADGPTTERLRLLAGAWRETMPDATLRAARGAATLASQAAREASVLAYDDAFLATAILSGAALVGLLIHMAVEGLRASTSRAAAGEAASRPA